MKRERNRKKTVFLIVWLAIIVALLAAVLIIGLPGERAETIAETMKDGVLHDRNRVSLFGLLDVSPALISAFAVTGILLFCALLIRIFAVPRFRTVPGRFQAAVEKLVGFFGDLAASNSPHKTGFVAAYIFSAGVYVFFSTLFELFGFQAVSTEGTSVTLPAPLADINGALAMGIMSFLVILVAGFAVNGVKGGLRVLKDFSLPVSMSFRIFGALLSGLMVTELVYYYNALSFLVPVVVAVLFTLLHAIIQTYVLTTLVSVFYGEAVEPPAPSEKKKKLKGNIKS
jgi:F-type H+-transporting ATPase subunit a